MEKHYTASIEINEINDLIKVTVWELNKEEYLIEGDAENVKKYFGFSLGAVVEDIQSKFGIPREDFSVWENNVLHRLTDPKYSDCLY